MEETKDEVQKDPMAECAAQLNSAAEALERVIGKLEAQYEALNQKIDRIIATVEKLDGEKAEVAANAETAPLKPTKGFHPSKPTTGLPGTPGLNGPPANSGVGRKTLPAVVNTLLAKSGVGEGVRVESSTLDRALGALTIEQRIAVKAELARAGMIA